MRAAPGPAPESPCLGAVALRGRPPVASQNENARTPAEIADLLEAKLDIAKEHLLQASDLSDELVTAVEAAEVERFHYGLREHALQLQSRLSEEHTDIEI